MLMRRSFIVIIDSVSSFSVPLRARDDHAADGSAVRATHRQEQSAAGGLLIQQHESMLAASSQKTLVCTSTFVLFTLCRIKTTSHY